MPLSERQRNVLRANALRDKAEALLQGLLDAKRVTERELERLNRPDSMRIVKGCSSIEEGIRSTRRMIETLNRSLAEARRELEDEDLAILDEVMEPHGAPPLAG